MQVITFGIDLAKNVFQIHGVDAAGHTVVKKQLKRDQLAPYFANVAPATIGMEACSSAHYWARKLQGMGHSVKLMAPQFVKPYVKGNKNDANDAEAICEAVARKSMRFVPIKNVEQQALLSLHCVRQGFVAERTAYSNRIRGLMGEFGFVIPQGMHYISERVHDLIEDANNELPGMFRENVDRLLQHLQELNRHVHELEMKIQGWHRSNEASQKLAAIPGIGPLTASALIASIGDAKNFKSGRELSAWLGLVPRQHSSGGKQNLLGISKRGDLYLRMLLVQGAHSVINASSRKGVEAGWLPGLLKRRNHNVAAVAVANKNARIAWALLARERQYETRYSRDTALT